MCIWILDSVKKIFLATQLCNCSAMFYTSSFSWFICRVQTHIGLYRDSRGPKLPKLGFHKVWDVGSVNTCVVRALFGWEGKHRK